MSGEKSCAGRVCVVTGAGTGLGRSHALTLAESGARVVVNDLGAALDGTAEKESAAQSVVEEIRGLGGEAIAHTEDISTWGGARSLIRSALDSYGQLDVLVNNAGILRDRMVFSMAEDDWDAVIRVHLKGTFATTRHATEYWRERSKAGHDNNARIINTTSMSGTYGHTGQSNYVAAKAGIAAFTQSVAAEVERYGVTANAVSPNALTRMNADLGLPEERRQKMDPRWASIVVAWLASPLSAGVTGQIIEASGFGLALVQGWTRGPKAADLPSRPEEVDSSVRDLLVRTPRRTSIKDPL
jgi:NAD(P)-dependent dehydrogenase (short-subunit alcohol dehydrogenase family)